MTGQGKSSRKPAGRCRARSDRSSTCRPAPIPEGSGGTSKRRFCPAGQAWAPHCRRRGTDGECARRDGAVFDFCVSAKRRAHLFEKNFGRSQLDREGEGAAGLGDEIDRSKLNGFLGVKPARPPAVSAEPSRTGRGASSMIPAEARQTIHCPASARGAYRRPPADRTRFVSGSERFRHRRARREIASRACRHRENTQPPAASTPSAQESSTRSGDGSPAVGAGRGHGLGDAANALIALLVSSCAARSAE